MRKRRRWEASELTTRALGQNYEAFREDNLVAGTRHRPELLMTPLVAVPLQLDVCSPSCPTHYAPRLGASSPASYPLAPSTSTSSAPPPCGPRARAGTLTGSYIPTPPIDQLYPPFAVPLTFHLATHSRTSTGYDAFVPSQCAWMHAGVRFADHAPCTRRDERVLFLGDSHGRAAFDVVKVRLEGGGAVASSSVKMEMRNATIGNLFMVRGRSSVRRALEIVTDLVRDARRSSFGSRRTALRFALLGIA